MVRALFGGAGCRLMALLINSPAPLAARRPGAVWLPSPAVDDFAAYVDLTRALMDSVAPDSLDLNAPVVAHDSPV